MSSRANDHLRVCEEIPTVDDAKGSVRKKLLEGDAARQDEKVSSLFAAGASAAGHDHGSHTSSVFRLHPNDAALSSQARWYCYAKQRISKVRRRVVCHALVPDTTTPRAPRSARLAPRASLCAPRSARRAAPRMGIKTLALAGALARSLSHACGALSLSRSRSLPRPCHQCLISASVCVCVRLSLPSVRGTTRRLARCCAHSSRPEPVGAFSTTRI